MASRTHNTRPELPPFPHHYMRKINPLSEVQCVMFSIAIAEYNPNMLSFSSDVV